MEGKRDYYEDIQLFKSNVVLCWSVVFLLFLFTLPLHTPNYFIYLINLMMVHAILAIGLNILVGYTGQIALGHNGFYAIGAYGTALLMSELHIPFILALPLAGFIAALCGFIVGLPALRLEGPYLAIATLGFGLTIMHIFGSWDIFGGRMGIKAPPLDLGVPQLGVSWVLKSDVGKFYLISTVAIMMVIAARNIMKTRIGRSFIAIRDSDIAAEVMGINLTIYKTLAFAISAFFAGIAGGLFSFVLGFFDPQTFNLMLSVIFIAMIVVGGIGSITGSIMGAVFITYLQYDLLKNVSEMPYFGDLMVNISNRWFTSLGLENFNVIALGLIMVVIIIFEPLGMYGIWLRIKKYWITWPF